MINIEPEEFLGKRVVLIDAWAIGDKLLPIGATGICTADLDDVFAVEFDKDYLNGPKWITFYNTEEIIWREKFKIL